MAESYLKLKIKPPSMAEHKPRTSSFDSLAWILKLSFKISKEKREKHDREKEEGRALCFGLFLLQHSDFKHILRSNDLNAPKPIDFLFTPPREKLSFPDYLVNYN